MDSGTVWLLSVKVCLWFNKLLPRAHRWPEAGRGNASPIQPVDGEMLVDTKID